MDVLLKRACAGCIYNFVQSRCNLQLQAAATFVRTWEEDLSLSPSFVERLIGASSVPYDQANAADAPPLNFSPLAHRPHQSRPRTSSSVLGLRQRSHSSGPSQPSSASRLIWLFQICRRPPNGVLNRILFHKTLLSIVDYCRLPSIGNSGGCLTPVPARERVILEG
jgi:hypothetical protein